MWLLIVGLGVYIRIRISSGFCEEGVGIFLREFFLFFGFVVFVGRFFVWRELFVCVRKVFGWRD